MRKYFSRKKAEKYDEIFVPGSPIRDRRYLFGREQEIRDLKNILKRPGQHAIVIGDRGVGKTSLVKQVLRDSNYGAVWRTCDPESSFSSVFHDLLEAGGIDFRHFEETTETSSEGELKGAPVGIGLTGKRVSKRSEKFTSTQSGEMSPWTVCRSLEAAHEKLVLVLDEYDAVHKSRTAGTFHQNTAYTIKHLADHNDRCDSKIVVVGVANSSAELLGKHESIQRSAREIYLRPLRREHIFDFLSQAETDLGIEFEFAVKDRLAKGSLGYPYFIHLVGLECVAAMLARDITARLVEWQDLRVGIKKSVDQAFRAELSKYKAIFSPANMVERSVIEGLAMYPGPYPQRTELREFVITRNGISEGAFEKALNSLTQEKRFLYMSRRSDEIRFIDPLMKAFIRGRILVEAGPTSDSVSELDDQPNLFDEEIHET